MEGSPSRGRRVYDLVYATLCGSHPQIRPWHFQWLAAKDLYRELRLILPEVNGRILDVGCGDKPYRSWSTNAREYVGLDVTSDSAADVVVRPGDAWPLDDASFDTVLSTQVLEHVGDYDNVRSEISRVLKPGGRAIVSVPFVFNEHGAPDDFRRYSVYGVREIFPDDWQAIRLVRLGGFGSASGVLLLNWIDMSLSKTLATKVLKALLLPLWIPFSAIVNGLGQVFDSVGDTSAVYVNVLAVFEKPAPEKAR
jgi:SAM-dependent methyltransferase